MNSIQVTKVNDNSTLAYETDMYGVQNLDG